MKHISATVISAVVIASMMTGAIGQSRPEGVPSLLGLTVAQAEGRLNGRSFDLIVDMRDSRDRRGTVIAQFPGEGGNPGPDGKILIHVSDGLVVPLEVEGEKPQASERILSQLGFTVQRTRRTLVRSQDELVAVVPNVGTRVDATPDPVTLVVSEAATIPNDLPLSNPTELMKRLDNIGLVSGFEDRTPSPRDLDPSTCRKEFVDRTYHTTPKLGSSVPVGSAVRIIHDGQLVQQTDKTCEDDAAARILTKQRQDDRMPR